jgi:hypothetical protein
MQAGITRYKNFSPHYSPDINNETAINTVCTQFTYFTSKDFILNIK